MQRFPIIDRTNIIFHFLVIKILVVLYFNANSRNLLKLIPFPNEKVPLPQPASRVFRSDQDRNEKLDTSVVLLGLELRFIGDVTRQSHFARSILQPKQPNQSEPLANDRWDLLNLRLHSATGKYPGSPYSLPGCHPTNLFCG